MGSSSESSKTESIRNFFRRGSTKDEAAVTET